MDNILFIPLAIQDFRRYVQEAMREELALNRHTAPDSALLDTHELCEELGITRPTVTKLRKLGTIPYLRIGNRIRFEKGKVLQALEGTRYGKGGRK